MENQKILYQIRSLEKQILRKFLNDKECIECELPKNKPTPTQMQIIEYILQHINEDINQKDLEDVLKLRRATVSGVLQTMEKNQLIERVTNSEDSRTKKIILNENAKKIFLAGIKRMEELEKVVIKDISEEELNTFLIVIEKMKNNIKETKK